MINAEEHKQLLAQIAEWERDNVSYFDVEKEFFLIDSNNLSKVKTRLYGYSIQATGIYEQDNLTPEAVEGLDGRGCYVYVEAQKSKITIKQDLNGCWGIYLFRHGDYFALSNSFFRLLDHVKRSYLLTVNRDYCHDLLINGVCGHSYSQTAVNEISLVERNAILNIDLAKKNLQIKLIDYKEHSVSLNSAEGVAILDRWIEFWGGILRGVSQNTKFITADLSGGFDTRISIVPLLHSGIDCSNMRINTYTDALHTHSEDYEIASKIADHYGWKLNQPLPKCRYFSYSLSDSRNIDLYHQQTVRNLPTMFVTQKSMNKIYYLKGYGGETLRGNWLRFGSWEDFKQAQLNITKRYSRPMSSELADSMQNMFNAALPIICDKYKITDRNSGYIQQYLYQDARTRHHHGKESCGYFLRNVVTIAPALDPEIRTLKLESDKCTDPKLLIALLFTRYEPDLLKFPFEGKRFIAPETIEYAKEINKRFPRLTTDKKVEAKTFNLKPRDLRADKILASSYRNKKVPDTLLRDCLKAAFESSRTYGLFTAYFNEELYKYAASYYETHGFGRERLMYAVFGIARVLEDVEISNRNRPLYCDMQRFIEQDFVDISNDAQTISKFRPYIAARIDIKLMSTEGELQIFSLSDDRANISKPAWFQKGGIGYTLNSIVGNLDFSVQATVDGQLQLSLKGLDVRSPEDNSKFIPYWIDYTKLIINGETIFDKITPAWHNSPYNYTLDVKADKEITVQVEWLPHRSDT